jgi:hypothetical protein
MNRIGVRHWKSLASPMLLSKQWVQPFQQDGTGRRNEFNSVQFELSVNVAAELSSYVELLLRRLDY